MGMWKIPLSSLGEVVGWEVSSKSEPSTMDSLKVITLPIGRISRDNYQVLHLRNGAPLDEAANSEPKTTDEFPCDASA